MANLSISGLSADQVYTELTTGGLTQTEASIFIGSWINEYYGKVQRTFNYVQPFPVAEPGCMPTFARTFIHQDWFDGENIVQAEQSGGEDGFNLRFHKIENDLDALAADVRKAFNCMATMRAGLRNLLDEIRNELNRLNERLGEEDVVRPPFVSTLPNTYGQYIAEQPKFLGYTKVDEQQYALWESKIGTMMLPANRMIKLDPGTDPRILRAAGIARLVEESNPVRDAYREGPVKVKDLIERFGDETTSQGGKLRDLVTILPSDAEYPNLKALVEDVTAREAAALRTTSGVGEALTGAFGLGGPQEAIATAPIEKFETIPRQAREALLKKGIDTVGKLAALDSAGITDIMGNAGVTLEQGDAAAWSQSARLLARF